MADHSCGCRNHCALFGSDDCFNFADVICTLANAAAAAAANQLFGHCRDAWHRLGNMTSEQAMTSYIDELKKVKFAFVSVAKQLSK